MRWNDALDVTAVGVAVMVAPILLFGVARIGVLFFRWRKAVRMYGPAHWSVGVDVYRFSGFGSLSSLRRATLLTMFVTALPLIGECIYASTEYRYVWEKGEWHWLVWVVLWQSAAVIWFVVECELAIPPAVLLLGPSSPELERELAALNRDLTGCRTLALLRPNEGGLFGLTRWAAYANNLRTRDLYQWRSIVFQLMDVVPVIVLCDDASAPVVEESRRIARHGYQPRTYVTTRARLADPSEHARLTSWLNERLGAVRDQSVRADRQQVFDHMRAILPVRLQYPQRVGELVEKASELLKLGGYRFVTLCKKLHPSQVPDGLMEDLPSAVSRAEELHFLRDDRVLEEMDILLDSVEEVVGETDGHPAMNRANLAVKRGQLARHRGDWDAAEKILRRAVEALYELRWTAAVQREAHCELGTAFYYLGDIALARHRETGDPQLLADAEKNYRGSMTYDEMGGGDTQAARRRLGMLSGRVAPLSISVPQSGGSVPWDVFKTRRQVAFRILRGAVGGGALGGLASVWAIQFVPEGLSTVPVVILYVLGLAGMGVFLEMLLLNRKG